MATKNLKSITFPGLPDKYTVVQPDGYYEDLTSGSTEEVISNVKITDQEPYTFRTSGGNAEIGSREEDTLVGVSVAFNQFFKMNNGTSTLHDCTITISQGNKASISGAPTAAAYFGNTYNILANHVYMMSMSKVVTGINISEQTSSLSFSGYFPFGTGKAQGIAKAINSNSQTSLGIYVSSNYDGTAVDIDFHFFDLTLMFGSDIADYLYTLEQAQAGEGVALVKKLGLNKYFGYNAGTLYSVQTDAHKITGFNQWDEEWELGTFNVSTGEPWSADNRIRTKNFIPIIPNAAYHAYVGNNYGNTPLGTVCYYDANHDFISVAYPNANADITPPNNAFYMRIGFYTSYGTTYNYDICISIHWDNSRDTDYEPYVLHNYPIDPVVLRGILKKDADGNIYADGDTYEADGTVTRRYGIVDLGTLAWSSWAGDNTGNTFVSSSLSSGAIKRKSENQYCVSSKYPALISGSSQWVVIINKDKQILLPNDDEYILIRDSSYSDAASFKTAMSGVYLVYELAEPTTEQATPFTTPQIVDNWGTEEYPDYAVAQGNREYSVPMGHITLYPISIRDKVEASADNPSNDGDYILHINGGKATYIPLIIEDELPQNPTTDGTYSLKVVISNGVATRSWVAE